MKEFFFSLSGDKPFFRKPYLYDSRKPEAIGSSDVIWTRFRKFTRARRRFIHLQKVGIYSRGLQIVRHWNNPFVTLGLIYRCFRNTRSWRHITFHSPSAWQIVRPKAES